MHQGTFALVPARVQGLLQSVQNEVGLHRTADPPVYDVSREDINNEGDVDEALPGRDVGEVGDPQLVRTISLEVPVHAIQRTRRLGSRHRGAHRLASASPTQPAQPHQSLDGASRHRCAFAPQLTPDLVGTVHLQVLVVHALHLGQHLGIALGSRGQQRWIALACRVTPICRRGDLQRSADRLDPQTSAVLVDEGIHFLNWRSSSAWAKYALASFRISLVLRSSRTSRSRSLMRCCSVVVGPAVRRCRVRLGAPTGAASRPCSRSCRLSTRSPPTATGTGPWRRRPCAPHAPAPRGKTSGTSSCWLHSQSKEPPQDPGRFIAPGLSEPSSLCACRPCAPRTW
jgi:hypothetical protein